MARRNIDLSVVLHGDNDYEDRQNIPQAAEGFAERLQGFHADYWRIREGFKDYVKQYLIVLWKNLL